MPVIRPATESHDTDRQRVYLAVHIIVHADAINHPVSNLRRYSAIMLLCHGNIACATDIRTVAI